MDHRHTAALAGASLLFLGLALSTGGVVGQPAEQKCTDLSLHDLDDDVGAIDARGVAPDRRQSQSFGSKRVVGSRIIVL
jgi:hypothetical protein